MSAVCSRNAYLSLHLETYERDTLSLTRRLGNKDRISTVWALESHHTAPRLTQNEVLQASPGRRSPARVPTAPHSDRQEVSEACSLDLTGPSPPNRLTLPFLLALVEVLRRPHFLSPRCETSDIGWVPPPRPGAQRDGGCTGSAPGLASVSNGTQGQGSLRTRRLSKQL